MTNMALVTTIWPASAMALATTIWGASASSATTAGTASSAITASCSGLHDEDQEKAEHYSHVQRGLAHIANLRMNPHAETTTTATSFKLLDKFSVFKQLDNLKQLPKDWNGYGAQPIDPDTIEAAERFIVDLPDNIITAPTVVPMTRGRLQFEWHLGNRSLELEFETPGRIHYLKADDDSGLEEENILFTTQMTSILELLRWFVSE
jgi:hypothetical protein